MLSNNLSVNIFFGQEFLCSSSTADGKKMIVGGLRFDIEPHVGLFEVDYLKKVTDRADVCLALSDFLSLDKFFRYNCNYLFDSDEYARCHGVVEGLHPVVHYLLLGDRAGARVGQFFWTDWVRASYPNDPRTALQIHMESQNWVAPNPYFDPVWYLNRYVDVFRGGIRPFRHYLRYGEKEGRSPHKLVDWDWYASVTGLKKPTWKDYLGQRWKVGVFPHPKARSGWAYLPEKELERLFESNLSPVVGVQRERASESHSLAVVPIHDLLRSISATFPLQESESLVRELLDTHRGSDEMQSVVVSVVLPTRNRLTKIKSAVESILSQTHRNVELLIVDDGGDDGTAKWVRGLDDQRIKLFECPPKGVSAARNTALKNATGEYIAFLDSDNAMLPEFVASMLAFCMKERVDFAYAGLRLYNDAGDVRYRFKPYEADSYWKTNYIDMNVIFHRRTPFADVRFDESLRRCVDWEYILKLCEISEPVPVPILGCNYYHDGAGIDRITLSGPVWDCFRVSQRHRRPPEKTGRAGSVILIPVTQKDIDQALVLLSRELPFLPSDVKVQCVVLASVPRRKVEALDALLASDGQPSVLLCHVPADRGALVDYGFGASSIDAERWHVVSPEPETSLLALLGRAVSAGTDTLIIPRCDSANMYHALQYGLTSRRWIRVWTDASEISGVSVPLEFDLLNLDAKALRPLDLRCGGSMALPLFVLKLHCEGAWPIVVEPRESAEWREDKGVPYMEGLNLLNKLDEYTPERSSIVSSPSQLAISSRYRVENSILNAVPVFSVKRRGPRLAILTPAPHRGSGWGDEFYAESLGGEMAALGVSTDVVYRKDWKNVGGEYSHALHIRGIIKAELKDGCKNLMWIISHPDAVGADELSRCDHVFTASSQHANELAADYGQKIGFLPQCTSFEPSPQLLSMSSGVLDRYAVFVGDSKKVLRYPIEDLIENWARFVLVGPNWRDADVMGLRYRSASVDNECLPNIYRTFGAVLNQHWPEMARLGFVSNRLYDIAASGGYFISDECKGMPEDLLDFGVVWSGGSMEDLFLARPSVPGSDRYERAMDFYEKNSFRKRASTILDLIG